MASLPEIPADEWLEDAVAAALQCAQYHVARNIHENEDGTELLELDIIASDYVDRSIDPLVVEVKSGNWGFGELFKLKGWVSYLGLNKAAFFASKELDARKRIRLDALVSALEIVVVTCPSYSPQKLLASLKSQHIVSAGLIVSDQRIELWRYAYWFERILLKRLRQSRDKGSEAGGTAIRYHNIVNDRVFFERHPNERARMLYDAWGELGYCTDRAANEVNECNPGASIAEALQEGRHPVIQGAMLVEHRARMAVLKAAVDVILTTPDVDAMLATFDGLTLRESFCNGLRALRSHEFVHRYPAFWQVFIYEWGGVISVSQREVDYKLLSEQTGIPVANIGEALSAFGHLFPTKRGWFRTILQEDPLEILQLVPPCFRAIGAIARLWRHTLDEDAQYEALPMGKVTIRTFGQWHNTAAELIRTA